MTETSNILNTQDPQRWEALIRASQELPATDAPAVVLPEGCKVESLEHLLDVPRAQRVTYKTERLEDFCRYVTAEEEGELTAAFVRPDGGGAMAVIDFGSHQQPMWRQHQAVLTMKHTPEFAALNQICGKALSQRDLTDWLEDWSDILKPVADNTAMPMPKALSAIRRVDVKASRNTTHEDADFRAARTSMEEIEARSADGKLPDLFDMTCQVYPCTKQRHVRARLSLLTGDDAPRFKLRIMGYDALMREVADEVELELVARLSGVRVFVGSV